MNTCSAQVEQAKWAPSYLLPQFQSLNQGDINMKLKHWLNLTVGAGILAITMASQAQQHGGTLSLIVQPEPPVLVPAINQQAPTQYVTGKIYESLLTYTHDLERSEERRVGKDCRPRARKILYK